MMIRFGVWAPSEEVFRTSWIEAGILLDQPGYNLSDQYLGVELSIDQGWPGIIEGVPGWHCNVTVTGPLVAEMTYGLNQTDEQGNLLSVFDRTWAPQIFSLTEQPEDPITGYPAGYRNSAGVMYADYRDFSTPANVRQ